MIAVTIVLFLQQRRIADPPASAHTPKSIDDGRASGSLNVSRLDLKLDSTIQIIGNP